MEHIEFTIANVMRFLMSSEPCEVADRLKSVGQMGELYEPDSPEEQSLIARARFLGTMANVLLDMQRMPELPEGWTRLVLDFKTDATDEQIGELFASELARVMSGRIQDRQNERVRAHYENVGSTVNTQH